MTPGKLIVTAVVSLCLLSMSCCPCFGQDGDSDIDSLYSLSLEQLMNMQIVTASKTSETVQQAPAVVSVVTAKEIESYGGSSLIEVLDRVTGVYMTGTYNVTNNLIALRGEADTHWCTEVLILINGRPYRDSFLGGSLVNVLNAYPLRAVDRLEIIRGPGSALYGTNAYVGVINIILKRASENHFSSGLRYGSFNTVHATASGAIKHNDLVLNTDVSFYNTDGWDFQARDESSIIRSRRSPVYDSVVNPPRTFNMMRQDAGAVLNAVYKEFSLTSFFGHSRWANMATDAQWVLPANSGPRAIPVDDNGMADKALVDIGYRKEISKRYTTSINVTWNNTYVGQQAMNSTNRTLSAHASDWFVEWQNSISLRDDLDAVCGFSANRQTGHALDYTLNTDGTPFAENLEWKNPNPFYIVPSWDETWYTGYIQMSYSPLDWLKMVGGVQANKINGIQWNYSPRGALVVTGASGIGAKLLYGEAFRAPTPGGEKSILIAGTIQGNANLKPEIIRTYETQIFVKKKRMEASIGYFYSRQSHLIEQTSASDPDNPIPNTSHYINSGGLKTYGVEAETKLYINSRFSGLASFSSQQSKTDEGYKNNNGMPLYMAKAGVSYEGNTGLNIAVYHSWFSAGGNTDATFSSDNVPDNFQGIPVNANPPMKAVHYMTANVRLSLQKFMNADVPDATLFCYAVNVLNANVYYPEFVRRNLNTIPGRAGFNIHAGITLKL